MQSTQTEAQAKTPISGGKSTEGFNATVTRMDALLDGKYEVKAFCDLSTPYQLAIVHYMAIDGEAWECLLDESVFGKEGVKASLPGVLPEYIRQYGETQWGVACIATERMKQAVMAGEEISADFSCWEDYAQWYLQSCDTPEHGNADRWPVILSSSDDETLQDGWHRLHSYCRDGHLDIPAVFYPEERHCTTAKAIKAAAELLGREIIIHTEKDLTPPGKRRVKVVRHAHNGQKRGDHIRWYVGTKAYRSLPITEENLALSAKWKEHKNTERMVPSSQK